MKKFSLFIAAALFLSLSAHAQTCNKDTDCGVGKACNSGACASSGGVSGGMVGGSGGGRQSFSGNGQGNTGGSGGNNTGGGITPSAIPAPVIIGGIKASCANMRCLYGCSNGQCLPKKGGGCNISCKPGYVLNSFCQCIKTGNGGGSEQGFKGNRRGFMGKNSSRVPPVKKGFKSPTKTTPPTK